MSRKRVLEICIRDRAKLESLLVSVARCPTKCLERCLCYYSTDVISIMNMNPYLIMICLINIQSAIKLSC